jgi:hypothetical protein
MKQDDKTHLIISLQQGRRAEDEDINKYLKKVNKMIMSQEQHAATTQRRASENNFVRGTGNMRHQKPISSFLHKWRQLRLQQKLKKLWLIILKSRQKAQQIMQASNRALKQIQNTHRNIARGRWIAWG